jgi:hypothetical protein
MISDEIAAALARFFEGGKGPSHDELKRAIHREGLAKFDPGATTGKMKRIRDVFSAGLNNELDESARLALSILALCRAAGTFRPTSENYAGSDIIAAASEAFSREGYELDPEGNGRSKLLEQMEGHELTEALRVYVRRARSGANDAALVSGTVKDLIEATARHALVETTGSYQKGDHFQATLYNAFDRLGLAAPSPALMKELDPDPRRAFEEVVYLLGCAVNRLRNSEGAGHGRPATSKLTEAEASLLSVAAGLCSQLLLDSLDGRMTSSGMMVS